MKKTLIILVAFVVSVYSAFVANSNTVLAQQTEPRGFCYLVNSQQTLTPTSCYSWHFQLTSENDGVQSFTITREDGAYVGWALRWIDSDGLVTFEIIVRWDDEVETPVTNDCTTPLAALPSVEVGQNDLIFVIGAAQNGVVQISGMTTGTVTFCNGQVFVEPRLSNVFWVESTDGPGMLQIYGLENPVPEYQRVFTYNAVLEGNFQTYPEITEVTVISNEGISIACLELYQTIHAMEEIYNVSLEEEGWLVLEIPAEVANFTGENSQIEDEGTMHVVFLENEFGYSLGYGVISESEGLWLLIAPTSVESTYDTFTEGEIAAPQTWEINEFMRRCGISA